MKTEELYIICQDASAPADDSGAYGADGSVNVGTEYGDQGLYVND